MKKTVKAFAVLDEASGSLMRYPQTGEYINASIAFAEVQEPYRPLSMEDEIQWCKSWIAENCKHL